MQASLNALWATQQFPGQDEKTPVLDFLASAQNRRGIVQEILPGRGKTRRIAVTYKQRLLESGVSENVANPKCAATDVNGKLEKEYEIDTTQNVNSGEVIDSDRFAEVCESNGALLAEIIASHIDVLDRKIATDITTQAALLAGTWGSGIFTTGNAVGNVNTSDEFVINTLKASSTDPNPMAWAKLRNALEKIGMGGNLFVACGDLLLEYMQATRSGCCSTSGIDVGAQFSEYGYAVMRDKRVVAAAALNGENKALVIQQGALQLLNYTKFGWKDGADIPDTAANYVHRAVTSPRGIRYDVMMKDDCGSLHLNVIGTTKLVGLPDDLFADGDEYAGVTKVAKVIVTNS